MNESYEQVPEQVKRENGGEQESYGTRYHELFGTPERAARTLHELCGGCCGLPERIRGDYDALLEWLRGEN